MGVDPLSIGLALGAGGMVAQGVGGFMGLNAQKQEAQAQQRMQDLQAQNQRLDQVRQARIARAKVVQAGVNQGAGESSSVATGASGIVNQAESNINFIDSQQQISNSIFKAKQDQLNAAGMQELGAGLEKAGAFAAGNAPAIQSIFGG